MNILTAATGTWWLKPALIAGGALALVGGGFWQGSQREHRTHVIREAAAAARIDAARVKVQAALDTIATQHEATEAARQVETREIIRESVRLVDRPVYRTVCVDADGASLFDRAAANANREGIAVAPVPAAVPAEDAPKR